MSVKVTFNKDAMNNLPVKVPCPNKECDATIEFKLGDVKKQNSVICSSCGVQVNLQEKE